MLFEFQNQLIILRYWLHVAGQVPPPPSPAPSIPAALYESEEKNCLAISGGYTKQGFLHLSFSS